MGSRLFSSGSAAQQQVGTPRLASWYRSLASAPASSYLLLLGDSTSFEINGPALYTRLRAIHTLPGRGLAGMTADAQHIVSGGNNGASLAAWWATTGFGTHSYTDGSGDYHYADTKALYATAEAAGGHLCIVLSFGLNDLRLKTDLLGTSGSAYLSFQSLLGTVTAQMRTDMPNASIVLRIPDCPTTDDVNANHYVQSSTSTINPAGGAQAIGDALRTAYLCYADTWPNVLVWNSHDRLFGRTAVASTQSTLWADQLHPSSSAYSTMADLLVQDLLGLPQPAPGQLPNPGAGGALDGIIATTRTPWTVDPRALEDAQHFALIGDYAGVSSIATGQTFIRFGPALPQTFVSNDILQVSMSNGLVALVGSGFTAFNAGGPVTCTQATIPALPTVPAGTSFRVRVYRELDQGDALLSLLRQVGPQYYAYMHLGRVSFGGASFVGIQAEPYFPTPSALVGNLWTPSTTDSLYVAGTGVNPLSLAVATKSRRTDGALQLNNVQNAGANFDFTGYSGRLALLVGTHAPEVVGNVAADAVPLSGTTAGTATSMQPFVGAFFKKALVYLAGYQNSTATAQTITYPTAFTTAAKFVKDDSGGATSTLTTLTLPASMGAPVTGIISIEGY